MRKSPIIEGVRKKLNPISNKRKAELVKEVEIRKDLCVRCCGFWQPVAWFGGEIIGGQCIGGYCEICGQQAGNELLHPHEKHFKSRGGKVSLENSVMAHNSCQAKEHGIKIVDSEPQWSRD